MSKWIVLYTAVDGGRRTKTVSANSKKEAEDRIRRTVKGAKNIEAREPLRKR